MAFHPLRLPAQTVSGRASEQWSRATENQRRARIQNADRVPQPGVEGVDADRRGVFVGKFRNQAALD